jgi:hypothetical protein
MSHDPSPLAKDDHDPQAKSQTQVNASDLGPGYRRLTHP